MHSLFEAMLIVGGTTALAALGVLVARRIFRHHQLSRHHQVAGYFLSVIGTLFALVLGLLVVNVESKYERAVSAAQTEANACSDIWNFSRGLAPAIRHSIRSSVKEFYTVAQKESFEKIAEGKSPEESDTAFAQLWGDLLAYQPVGNRQSSCYQSCLQVMQDLSDARSYRVTFTRRGLAPIVWVVLITGGVLIVAFTYLFFVESRIVQVVLTVLMAGFIALNLLLVTNFEHPYREHLHVQAGAFSFNPDVFDDPSTNTNNVHESVPSGAGK